jgi:cytochrome c oxidase assembly protein subunit 15
MTRYKYYTPSIHRRRNDPAVGLWLLATAFMILLMAVIGAITRLTESGLSIMEWAPISGALPPMSDAEWQRLFDLYKQIPEYQQINRGMSLAEFKGIFWWEWVHRLWGRLIGLVYGLPLLWFFFRGRLDRAKLPHLFGILALGAAQGLLGWFMVESGFAERTDVSQYRLAAHLSLALLIYAYVFWMALGFLQPEPEASAEGGMLRGLLVAFLAVLAVTLISGAFVAGTNAGLIYNSFPLMGDYIVPPEYGQLQPFIMNVFENVAAIQFNHRILAMLTVGFALGLWLLSRRLELAPGARAAFTLLALLACAQLGLGIATLLNAVPVALGAAHQAGAILVLTAAVFALYQLRIESGGR